MKNRKLTARFNPEKRQLWIFDGTKILGGYAGAIAVRMWNTLNNEK